MSGDLAPETGEAAGTLDVPWVAVVNRVAMTACEIILLLMMLLIIAEVVARSFFGFSLQFVDEYASYTLVWVTFLGMAVALHDGALFRVGILYDRLPALPKCALQVVWDLMSLSFSVVMAWQCARQVLSSHEREMVAPTVIATPLWLPQLVMPIGAGLVVLVLTAITVTDIAKLTRGGK